MELNVENRKEQEIPTNGPSFVAKNKKYGHNNIQTKNLEKKKSRINYRIHGMAPRT